MNKERVAGKKGSADFFKDSGLPNPEEFMKVRFVSIIRDVLVERGLGPDEAVETLEISESELAVLQEGRCADFSLDCLLLLLEKLGLYIEFVPHEIPAGATPKGFRISTSF
ncbi:hypothetical protein F4009_10025 [Candidatus Poribacteria bacterium]|nr:hypothetical protein [Candidatus Poribacteria bacterium]MYK94313.1 hypothetical protein [Candidatus Poribacteria bacterium]